MVEDAAAAKRLFQRFEKVAEGVFLTRDLVSEPANVLFPKSLAAEARKLDKLGVKVTVLGEKEMKRLGMGALLGVAQGSAQEPQLLVKIGRASCRERVCQYVSISVVAGPLKKNKKNTTEQNTNN